VETRSQQKYLFKGLYVKKIILKNSFDAKEHSNYIKNIKKFIKVVKMQHKNSIKWKLFYPIFNFKSQFNFNPYKKFYITIQSRSHQQNSSLFVSHFKTLENPLKGKQNRKNDKKDLVTKKD